MINSMNMNIQQMTKKKLIEYCKTNKIRKYSNKNKVDLLSLINCNYVNNIITIFNEKVKGKILM